MSITLNSSTTNNSDWRTQFQFTDGETGDLLDFTGATIEVEVRDADWCKRIEATTSNGKITIVGLGTFELDIPAQEMKCLYPGSYQIGGVYSLNDEIISLFVGSLSIVSGVARL